jgi:hypothetical protein
LCLGAGGDRDGVGDDRGAGDEAEVPAQSQQGEGEREEGDGVAGRERGEDAGGQQGDASNA